MKQFFKITFACILAIFIAGFLGTILLVVGLITFSSMPAPTYTPSGKTVFKLELNTAVEDRAAISPMDELRSTLSREDMPIGLDDVLASIEKAKNNKYIKGIYLTTDGYLGSYAITEEIRRKLKDFKESGKFVIAYNNNYTQNQYYLSSVADSVFLNPVGSLSLTGLAVQNMFFKNALDKLGVQMQIFRVGTFKSAIEPYILDQMSPANREQTQTYLNSMWNTIATGIAEDRNLSIETINNLTNSGIAFMEASDIENTGLVSGLKYHTEILPLLKKMTDDENLDTPDLSKMITMKSDKKNESDKIALLYAVGEITDGKSDGIYWKETVKEIEELKENKSVKAVVFRVNSPGGSAFASEQIWEAISQLKEKKPVVVSMGTYAASGGYYISCNANYIVAEPTTLTGSIGVFGMIPNANDLLTKKIGITFDEVKTNKFGTMSITEPMTEEEKVLMQRGVENIYSLFLKRCAEGRDIPVDSIAKIAEGRVWSGVNALQIGLVDELGGMQVAIDKAASLAGIDKYSVNAYPVSKDFFETLMEEFTTEISTSIRKQILGEDYKQLQILDYIRSMSPIQARMEDVTVY